MLILRRTPKITLRLFATRTSAVRNYSKDYDSSDDEHDSKKHKLKSSKMAEKPIDTGKADQQGETAAAKLNRLLASMSTDDPYSLAKSNETNTSSSPGNLNRKRRESLKEEAAKKDVFTAAKRVASMLGDEQQQKQTESELLARLLGHTEDDSKKTEAANKKGTPDSDMSLSELIVGMKIDRNPQRQENLSRSDYVRRTLASARNQQDRTGTDTAQRTQKYQPRKREAESYTGSVNLYGAEPMAIFKNPNDLKESPDILSTWAYLQERDLKLQVTHPPSNYFEKIALWTEQGKVWRFPIDNEQDWHLEETDVDFSEHIFLEQHLESWCPTKGPIRHFMELVCVGLSKNPYITAREKREHILWYRDYFAEKRDMLKEYMLQEKPKRLSEKQTS